MIKVVYSLVCHCRQSYMQLNLYGKMATMKLKEVLLRRREVHVDGFELGYKRLSRDAEIARAVAAVVGAISRFTKTKRSNQINPITICRSGPGGVPLLSFIHTWYMLGLEKWLR